MTVLFHPNRTVIKLNALNRKYHSLLIIIINRWAALPQLHKTDKHYPILLMATKSLPLSSIPLQVKMNKSSIITFSQAVTEMSEFLASSHVESLSTDTRFHLTELQKYIEWAQQSHLEPSSEIKSSSKSEKPKKKKKRDTKEDDKPKKQKKQRKE